MDNIGLWARQSQRGGVWQQAVCQSLVGRGLSGGVTCAVMSFSVFEGTQGRIVAEHMEESIGQYQGVRGTGQQQGSDMCNHQCPVSRPCVVSFLSALHYGKIRQGLSEKMMVPACDMAGLPAFTQGLQVCGPRFYGHGIIVV